MLVVTGAVAFDYIFSFPGRFADYILPQKLHVINVSCVVNQVKRRFGGTGGNQAYTLALLGTKPILLAAAGGDFTPYDRFLRQAGVDTSYLIRDKKLATAVGFALYDKDNNQIWGFAKNAMARADQLRLAHIRQPVSFVLITSDEFKAIGNYLTECQKRKIPYVFDPAFDIPKLEVDILRRGVAGAIIVFGNDYEIALLKKRTDFTYRQLTKGRIVVTTLGEKGSLVEADGKKILVKPARPKKITDPAGAGDAYRAGFIAGYLCNLDLKTCAQMGSLAASYTLECHGTITHTFTQDEFCRRYKENFGEKLILN